MQTVTIGCSQQPIVGTIREKECDLSLGRELLQVK